MSSYAAGKAAVTVAFAVTLATALQWDGPEPTGAIQNAQVLDWSRRAEPTPAPAIDSKWAARNLLPRQNGLPLDLCGYDEGITASSLNCQPGIMCLYATISRVVGCCAATDCIIPTACIDADMYSSSRCTGSCILDPQTIKCTKTGGDYCMTLTDRGYDFVNCNSVASTGSIEIPFLPSDTSTYSPTTKTFFEDTTTTLPESTTTLKSTRSLGASATSDGSLTDSPPSTSSPSSPPTPVAAIAGGVVGGVAVLALIGLGIFFLVKKNRQDGTDQVPVAMPPPGAPPTMRESTYYDPAKPPPPYGDSSAPGGPASPVSTAPAPQPTPGPGHAVPPHHIPPPMPAPHPEYQQPVYAEPQYQQPAHQDPSYQQQAYGGPAQLQGGPVYNQQPVYNDPSQQPAGPVYNQPPNYGDPRHQGGWPPQQQR